MHFTLGNNKDDKINLFYLLEALLGALVPSLEMLDYGSLASLMFNASFVVVITHFVVHLLTKRIYSNGFYNLLIYICMIAIAFVSVGIVTTGSMGFNYLKKFIIFSMVFLLMFIYSEEKINKKTLKAIVTVFYLLAVFFIIFFFFMGGNEKTNGKQYSTAITMGLSNPNLTGMWLGTIIYFIVFSIGMMKNFVFRIVSIGLIGLLVYMITITESRNSLMSLVVFSAIWLIYKLKKNKKMNTFVVTLLIIAPLLFVGIYFAVLDTSFVDNLDFLVSEGKALDSRVSTWNKALDAINGIYIFTGNYDSISNGTGESQMHNISLDMLSSYGVIVFIISVIYLVRLLMSAINKDTGKKINIGLLCFIGIWLFGFGEAGFLTGGSGMYLPACLMFALGCGEINKTEMVEQSVA